MMRILAFILSFLTTLISFSQVKTVVVQIDTLELINEDSDFKLLVTNQGFGGFGVEYDSAYYLKNRFPNYVNWVSIETDSSVLKIPFDNIQGYIEIPFLFNSGLDTIRIYKHRLFSNCNYDTVKTQITYFSNDTVVDLKKSGSSVKVEQLKCKRKPPVVLKININGILYEAPVLVSKELGGLMETGHGYKRTWFGKEKNRFYYLRNHAYQINSVQIILKENLDLKE